VRRYQRRVYGLVVSMVGDRRMASNGNSQPLHFMLEPY